MSSIPNSAMPHFFAPETKREPVPTDVFGEELKKPAYRDVERIAIAGAVIARVAGL